MALLVALKLLILMSYFSVYCQTRAPFFLYLLVCYLVKQGYGCINWLSCTNVFFFTTICTELCVHITYITVTCPKKLCRYFVKCIVFYTSSLLIFHACFCKHFPYSSCEKSISDLKFKKWTILSLRKSQ